MAHADFQFGPGDAGKADKMAKNPKAARTKDAKYAPASPPVHRVTAREEFRALVRKRIISASVKCFESSGYGATTMDAIAKDAGISRTAIYQHFRYKSEILYEAVQQSEPQWIGAFADALPLQVRGKENVRAGIAKMFNMYKRNITFLRVILEAASIETSVSNWLELEFQKHVADVSAILLVDSLKTPLAQNQFRMRIWIAVTAMDNVFRRVLDPRWSLNEEVAIDEIARMWEGILEATDADRP